MCINNIHNTSGSSFEVGDQILQINGEIINSVETFTHIMGLTDIGHVVKFTIKRLKKKEKESQVVMAKKKQQACKHPWGAKRNSYTLTVEAVRDRITSLPVSSIVCFKII